MIDQTRIVWKKTFCHPTALVVWRNDGFDRQATYRHGEVFNRALTKAGINHAIGGPDPIIFYVGKRNSGRAERLRKRLGLPDYIDSR